jgi:hypothetical protein
MTLIKLCAYTRFCNGLFCNSTAYARASAHLTLVALRVHWDVCVSVGWRSWGCGSLTPPELLESHFRPSTPFPSKHRPLSPTSVLWHPSVKKVTQDATLDESNTLIQEALDIFQSSNSWEEFVPKVRDARGDFHPDVGKVPHPAAHLLNRFQIAGSPVTCSGIPWTFAQKAEALTRGSRQSARQHIPFLRQEIINMIRKGQWTLLPVRLVLNELQLSISPLGVVPQRDRHPRTISDSSFFGVNHETVPVSPEECMQFGRALLPYAPCCC